MVTLGAKITLRKLPSNVLIKTIKYLRNQSNICKWKPQNIQVETVWIKIGFKFQKISCLWNRAFQ